MTKIEKVVIGLIIVCALGIAFNVGWLATRPDGYIREVIVEAGREIKQISREISE